MADLSEIRSQLANVSKSMGDIKNDLADATNQTSDFTNKLSELASIRSTGGSIWSAFARFTKGNLFFIQKQLRGFSNIAKVAVNLEKDRVERQKRLMAEIKTQVELLDKTAKSLVDIDNLLSSSNKKVSKAVFLQDSYNKLKIREMGFEKFLGEQREEALVIVKKQLAQERALTDTQKVRKTFRVRLKPY